MKKWILLLLFVPLINACSKSDDDSQTFLEKYDGVGFILDRELEEEDPGLGQYIYFYNSDVFMKAIELENIVISWDPFEEHMGKVCLDYWEGEDYYEPNSYTYTLRIVTNKNDTLILEFTEEEPGYEDFLATVEFTVSGTILTMKVSYSDGDDDFVDSYIKTDVTRSSLTCDVNEDWKD